MKMRWLQVPAFGILKRKFRILTRLAHCKRRWWGNRSPVNSSIYQMFKGDFRYQVATLIPFITLCKLVVRAVFWIGSVPKKRAWKGYPQGEKKRRSCFGGVRGRGKLGRQLFGQGPINRRNEGHLAPTSSYLPKSPQMLARDLLFYGWAFLVAD